MTRLLRPLFLPAFVFLLTSAAPPAAPAAHESLLDDLQHELTRAAKELAKADPAPYYLSYTIADDDTMVVVGTNGAIVSSAQVHTRRADVITRVGSPPLAKKHGEKRAPPLVTGAQPPHHHH